MTDNRDIPPVDNLCSEVALPTPVTNLCAEVPYEPRTFQSRVGFWIDNCFGAECAADILERQDRFLEEVFELLQAQGYDPDRILSVRDYTYARPVGEPAQELGGVILTLCGLATATSLDVDAAGEAELKRVWTKVDRIRAKQAAKPKFQAEPIALERDANIDEERALQFATNALRESGFDEEEVEGFASGDITGMSRDAVLLAISNALKAPRHTAGEILHTNIVSAIEAELGRQGDEMPEVESVGEPDGNRLALAGTFDLDGLANAMQNLLLLEMHSLNHAYGEIMLQVEELRQERDNPGVLNFLSDAQKEAWHQRERWGEEHDAGKTDLDWFWTLGFLSQKAAQAAILEDYDKALHHTISSAAMLANWHERLKRRRIAFLNQGQSA